MASAQAGVQAGSAWVPAFTGTLGVCGVYQSRSGGRSVQHLGDAAARAAGRALWQGARVEPLATQDLALGGRRRRGPGVESVEHHMIAGKDGAVVVRRQQRQPAGRADAGLFLKLPDRRFLERLAALHAAAGEVPARRIAVLDQQNAPLVVENHHPHAQRQPPQAPHGEAIGRQQPAIEATLEGHRRSLRRRLAAREAGG